MGEVAEKAPQPTAPRTRVAVLALQGAFAEHERAVQRLGATYVELRDVSDLHKPFDRLILPGGESTVQGKLLRELGMLGPLRERIQAGMPVLGTCAGLILLARRVEGGEPSLATMDVTVARNAYGRQLGSFHVQGELAGLGRVPMSFIRAPYIVQAGPRAQVLSRVDGRIVAARQGNQLGLAFHPELDGNPRVHELFLSL